MKVDVVLLFHTILPVNGPVLVPVLPRPAHVAPLLTIDAVSVPPVTPPPLQPLRVSLTVIVTFVAVVVMPGCDAREAGLGLAGRACRGCARRIRGEHAIGAIKATAMPNT